MASAAYRAVIKALDKHVPPKLVPLWDHPAGPKTIFFWAPLFKWTLVIAGIGDLNRPADKLSPTQSIALMATGFIWSRYSLVIIPKNYSLFAVNFTVGLTGTFQFQRVVAYRYSLKEPAKAE